MKKRTVWLLEFAIRDKRECVCVCMCVCRNITNIVRAQIVEGGGGEGGGKRASVREWC